MPEHKQYTRSEVKKSNGNGKTLIILHDKVYDVAAFLNEHPGGEEILLDQGGKDASEDFDDVGHSKEAFEIMKNYVVGELVENERSNTQPRKGWKLEAGKQRDKFSETSGMSFYLLLAGLAVIAVSIFYINS